MQEVRSGIYNPAQFWLQNTSKSDPACLLGKSLLFCHKCMNENKILWHTGSKNRTKPKQEKRRVNYISFTPPLSWEDRDFHVHVCVCVCVSECVYVCVCACVHVCACVCVTAVTNDHTCSPLTRWNASVSILLHVPQVTPRVFSWGTLEVQQEQQCVCVFVFMTQRESQGPVFLQY